MLKRIGLGLFMVLLGHVVSAAPVPPESAVGEKVDRVVAKAISDNRIVGTVVVVAQHGKVLYHKASGLADRENNRPMQKDTVLRLASMTKPLVSAAVLRLVDQHVLKLDDPVTKWLPDFKPRTADGTAHTITIRHLLTHTAGLNYCFLEVKDGPYHRLGVSDGLNDIGISLDENLSRISRAPLLFAPGASWQYSLATDVLGRVIEKATRQDLASALRKLITEPLAMKDTEFVASHPERLAAPYADAKPVPLRMPPQYQMPFAASTVDYSPGRAFNKNAYPSGGAGMVGTAGDYLRFLEAIRTGGFPLLKPETDEVLFTNSTGALPILGRGPGWGWTLMSSILVDPKTANSVQGKDTIEWGGAYGGNWWVDRSAGLTVVILTNTTFEGMSGAFPAEVKKAVYEALK